MRKYKEGIILIVLNWGSGTGIMEELYGNVLNLFARFGAHASSSFFSHSAEAPTYRLLLQEDLLAPLADVSIMVRDVPMPRLPLRMFPKQTALHAPRVEGG